MVETNVFLPNEILQVNGLVLVTDLLSTYEKTFHGLFQSTRAHFSRQTLALPTKRVSNQVPIRRG